MDPSDSTASTSAGTNSITQVENASQASSPEDPVPSVRVKLKKPKSKLTKKVSWTEDTVDNETLGRKKSKCCCIYQKPREELDESTDSDSEGECEHCSGHVEAKHKDHASPPSIPSE